MEKILILPKNINMSDTLGLIDDKSLQMFLRMTWDYVIGNITCLVFNLIQMYVV